VLWGCKGVSVFLPPLAASAEPIGALLLLLLLLLLLWEYVT